MQNMLINSVKFGGIVYAVLLVLAVSLALFTGQPSPQHLLLLVAVWPLAASLHFAGQKYAAKDCAEGVACHTSAFLMAGIGAVLVVLITGALDLLSGKNVFLGLVSISPYIVLSIIVMAGGYYGQWRREGNEASV